MTVNELSQMVQSTLEIQSGYNRKILCRAFNAKKHHEIAERVVTAIWSEIRVKNGSGYNSFARPVICAFVSGHEEYLKTHKED